MLLFVTQVVNALLCSDELFCPFDQSGVAVAGATNAANMRQSEALTVSLFFPPLHPHAINPTATTHGHFVLSPVLLASRDQDAWRPVELKDQHLRSHRKIGDCEQSRLSEDHTEYLKYSCSHG